MTVKIPSPSARLPSEFIDENRIWWIDVEKWVEGVRISIRIRRTMVAIQIELRNVEELQQVWKKFNESNSNIREFSPKVWRMFQNAFEEARNLLQGVEHEGVNSHE